MSDRRPPQRPAPSAARRPASYGARPSGSRPSEYRPSGARPSNTRPAGSPGSGSRRTPPRRTPPRRSRHANGRFYVFLGILALVVIAAVLLIWQPWASSGDPSAPVGATPTPTPTAQPAIAPANATPDAQPNSATQTGTPLSELLGSEDTNIAGLSADQMVEVSDLSVNPGLPTKWMNVLLLGVDQRIPDESCRSDTMIICSINTQSGEVKLTSLMRDSAVEYTSLGSNNGTYRLNAANYFGGPELAMKTINELLGMNIEKYVMVNFTGFTQICEALGGITIDISQAEMEQINQNSWYQYQVALQNDWDESNLESTNHALEEYGPDTHLNGRQALAYARIRKIDSDKERTNRQRKVLVAMLDQVRNIGMGELLASGSLLMQYTQTNMTFDEIFNVASKVLQSGLDDVETTVLPLTGTYVQETRNNQSMFYDIDWEANARELQNFIYY